MLHDQFLKGESEKEELVVKLSDALSKIEILEKNLQMKSLGVMILELLVSFK